MCPLSATILAMRKVSNYGLLTSDRRDKRDPSKKKDVEEDQHLVNFGGGRILIGW